MNTAYSPRTIALIGGIGYLIIFFTGIFANFFVVEGLVVKEDATTTFTNIVEQLSLFRVGVLAFVGMVIADLVLTWALYEFFQPTHEQLSLFAAWFRLVNCAVFGVAVFHLFDVLTLAGDAQYSALVSAEYAQAEVMRSFANFNYTWLLGLVFFGVHLLALGFLILWSGFVPKFIGYLLLLAGAGYLADSFAQFVLTNYEDYQHIFALVVIVPGVVGELSLTVWLLIRGGVNNISPPR